MSTARQVPFENAVFVGDSPQDMHGENADEQLANPQKRICLIEFLIMVGLLFVKARRPDQKFKKSHFIATFFMCRPQSAGLCD
jgi:hypothetical protein